MPTMDTGSDVGSCGHYENRARELGYRVLETDTSVDRIAARQLYLRCGFHDVGRAIFGGQWECVLFKKEITNVAA